MRQSKLPVGWRQCVCTAYRRATASCPGPTRSALGLSVVLICSSYRSIHHSKQPTTLRIHLRLAATARAHWRQPLSPRPAHIFVRICTQPWHTAVLTRGSAKKLFPPKNEPPNRPGRPGPTRPGVLDGTDVPSIRHRGRALLVSAHTCRAVLPYPCCVITAAQPHNVVMIMRTAKPSRGCHGGFRRPSYQRTRQPNVPAQNAAAIGQAHPNPNVPYPHATRAPMRCRSRSNNLLTLPLQAQCASSTPQAQHIHTPQCSG